MRIVVWPAQRPKPRRGSQVPRPSRAVSGTGSLVCEQYRAGSSSGLRGQETLQGRAGGVDALTNRYKSTPCKRLLKSAKVMLDGLRQEKFSDRASQDAFQGS